MEWKKELNVKAIYIRIRNEIGIGLFYMNLKVAMS